MSFLLLCLILRFSFLNCPTHSTPHFFYSFWLPWVLTFCLFHSYDLPLLQCKDLKIHLGGWTGHRQEHSIMQPYWNHQLCGVDKITCEADLIAVSVAPSVTGAELADPRGWVSLQSGLSDLWVALQKPYAWSKRMLFLERKSFPFVKDTHYTDDQKKKKQLLSSSTNIVLGAFLNFWSPQYISSVCKQEW